MPDFGDEISRLTNDNLSRDGAAGGTTTTTNSKHKNHRRVDRGTSFPTRGNPNAGVGSDVGSGVGGISGARISSRETKSRTPKGQGLGRTDKGPGLAPVPSTSTRTRRHSNNNNR